MHSIQSLAHRAPPAATRTRIRWQPYAQSSMPSGTLSTHKSPYLNTPTTSVTSSPSHSISDVDRVVRLNPITAANTNPKTKTKYALGLVDQAVKVLGDIWHPQDIPEVFTTTRSTATALLCSDLTVSFVHASISALPRASTNQLPSPVTPSTSHASPISSSSSSCSPSSPYSVQIDQEPEQRKSLVPVRTFVQEVLKRSKTTGSVLQTALCYLEAIRPQINDLADLEKVGQGPRGEPESDDRIVQGTPADFDIDASLSMDIILNPTPIATPTGATAVDAQVETTVLTDQSMTCTSTVTLDAPSKKAATAPLPPLPPLPSPLLCPRRAFLASLILASKFMQDKCYSNRAWAKLSGLPPREIGRCERALGDALGWRLWVGKAPVVDSMAALTASRALARCRSDGSIGVASQPTSFFVSTDSTSPSAAGRALRRTATLPANAFGPAETAGPSLSAFVACGEPMLQVPKSDIISPSTPGLTYSPSSTESSSGGDRTVQMTSFLDDTAGAYASSDSFSSSSSSFTMDWNDGFGIAPKLTGAKTGLKANFFANDLPPPQIRIVDSSSYGTFNTTGQLDSISSIMWNDGPTCGLTVEDVVTQTWVSSMS